MSQAIDTDEIPVANHPEEDTGTPSDTEDASFHLDQELSELEMPADADSEAGAGASSSPSSPQTEAGNDEPGDQTQPQTLSESRPTSATENETTALTLETGPGQTIGPSQVSDVPPQAGSDGIGPQPAGKEEAVQPQHALQGRLWRLAARPDRAIAAAAVAILAFMDVPFARLKERTKMVLGCVGVATFLVAVATWIAGSYLPPG